MSNINAFAISTEKEYSIDSTSFAVGKNLEYLCAVLNSKAVFFYFKLGSVIWGKDGIKWFGNYFDNIPVPIANSNTIEVIKNLVVEIMEQKEKDSQDTTSLENEIDLLTYKLYGLNYEEVKVIDPEIESIISEKGYNKRPAIEALPAK